MMRHVWIVLPCLWSVSHCQTLYSATLQWLPTRNMNEMQISYHLAWQKQNGSCLKPVCLQAYSSSGMTVQILGRWAGFSWNCQAGCQGNNLISDISKMMFTEVAGYADDSWESGEEILVHQFGVLDDDNVQLAFNFPNGTAFPFLGNATLLLAQRSDTSRPNISPSVVVMPIYRVPQGCSITIDLFPFDGDGDVTRCRWSVDMATTGYSATMEEDACRVSIQATSGNGYTSTQPYTFYLHVEDFSLEPIQLIRNGMTSSSGPFSTVPVVFSVHVVPALSSTQLCIHLPTFKANTPSTAELLQSRMVPYTNVSVTFLSNDVNTTIVSLGPRGMLFTNVSGGTGKTGTWTKIVNDEGISRACAMVYSQDGVPGEIKCATFLNGDTDQCLNASCGSAPCHKFFQYHTCGSSSPTEASSLGLILGIVGGVLALVFGAIIVVIVLIRKKINKQKKVSAEKQILHTS